MTTETTKKTENRKSTHNSDNVSQSPCQVQGRELAQNPTLTRPASSPAGSGSAKSAVTAPTIRGVTAEKRAEIIACLALFECELVKVTYGFLAVYHEARFSYVSGWFLSLESAQTFRQAVYGPNPALYIIGLGKDAAL